MSNVWRKGGGILRQGGGVLRCSGTPSCCDESSSSMSSSSSESDSYVDMCGCEFCLPTSCRDRAIITPNAALVNNICAQCPSMNGPFLARNFLGTCQWLFTYDEPTCNFQSWSFNIFDFGSDIVLSVDCAPDIGVSIAWRKHLGDVGQINCADIDTNLTHDVSTGSLNGAVNSFGCDFPSIVHIKLL